MLTSEQIISELREIHAIIRDRVVAACEAQSVDHLASVAERHAAGDTIYTIDRVSEEALVELITDRIAVHEAVVLVAEGIEEGLLILPQGATQEEARWRIIVDPIDGTRGLMYQKRPGWILTGVAPNNGSATIVQDIDIAIQTEIPLVKQHLSDCIWAIRGEGVSAQRYNRISGETIELKPEPSSATTIADGFAMISRFFPGGRGTLASVDDDVVDQVLGPVEEGVTRCFEDQYICSGGQLYELMCGHDRFVADLRPLLQTGTAGICCHPYDLCTVLIAQELGVIITDANGEPLDFWLDVHSDVAWCGYANEDIRKQIQPALKKALKKAGL